MTEGEWICHFKCDNCGHKWKREIITGNSVTRKHHNTRIYGPNLYEETAEIVYCPNCDTFPNVYKNMDNNIKENNKEAKT